MTINKPNNRLTELSLLQLVALVIISAVVCSANGQQQSNYSQHQSSNNIGSASQQQQQQPNDHSRLTPSSISLLEPYPSLTSNVHCIQSPPKLQAICGNSLGWASQMRLPNLLGHRSHEELTSESSLPALAPLLQELANDRLECKSLDQLKLLVCATISPLCLDVVLPPCRQLCLRAKTGCRSAMQRLQLEWPKFLDCRRFPSSPNDVCIGRQPALFLYDQQQQQQAAAEASTQRITTNYPPKSHGNNLDQISTSTTAPMMPTNTTAFESTSGQISTISTSLTSSITTTTTATTTKRRHKSKKDRRKMTTTTTAVVPIASSEMVPTTTMNPHHLETVTNPQTFVSSTFAPDMININTTTNMTISEESTRSPSVSGLGDSTATTTLTTAIASTTMAPLSTSNAIFVSPTETTTTAPAQIRNSGDGLIPPGAPWPLKKFEFDKYDLTQLLCAASPDWFIKAKLTQSQIESAVQRRKFKVRSYRQIFGKSLNGTAVARPGSANGKSPSPSVILLSLSNSTTLLMPLGNSLWGLDLSDPSGVRSLPMSSGNASLLSSSSSQTYLISGTTTIVALNASTQATIKTVSYVIPWPGSARGAHKDEVHSYANTIIVMAYRDFKLHGTNTCQLAQKRSLLAASIAGTSGQWSLGAGEQQLDTTLVMSAPADGTVTGADVSNTNTSTVVASGNARHAARQARTRKHPQQQQQQEQQQLHQRKQAQDKPTQ